MLLKIAPNVKYCSNVAQSAKKCLRVLKMQNSASNSKNYSKGAQRSQERPTGKIVLIAGNFTGLPFLSPEAVLFLVSTCGKVQYQKSAIHTVGMLRVKSDNLIG